MSSNPQTPFPQDTGNSFAEEFLLHPDFRVVASFLLGWVFWGAITYACRSQFFHQFTRLCWSVIRGPCAAQAEALDIEAQASPVNEEKSRRPLNTTPTIRRISNESVLVFTLNICFAFAGLAEFASLLAYDLNGDTACAFTMAWGSMSAQATRLIGLVILVLELHFRRGNSVEFYCLCAALVVGLSFILAYTATNTGAVTFVNTLGLTLCDRSIYAPTALLSSFGFIILELYVGTRFLGWDGCKTGFRAFFAQSANFRVARAGGLVLLDILTIVPNAIVTNRLAQFVPFSIGALVVLGVFNHGVVVSVARVSTPLVLSTQPSRAPTPLTISQPTDRPPSVIGAEIIMDNPGIQAEDQEPVLNSPFVLIHPHGKLTSPLLVPSSAPPRIGDASVFDAQQRRQILPFQVQYAEQLERHIHTGPIVAPIRTKRKRPHVQVIIEDVESAQRSQKSSSLIGSDIVRRQTASATSVRTDKRLWSPDNPTPSDYTNSRSSHDTPVARTPTTFRDSTMSMPLTPARTLSSGSRVILSAAASRHPSHRKIRSPAESSLKLPWRSAPRQSYSSAKTFGGREELPILVEGRAEPSGSLRASRMSTATTKRMVISRPHSLRSARPSSPQPTRASKELPMPSTTMRSRTSQQYLTVLDIRSPVMPSSPSGSSIRPSSQYVIPSPTLPTSPPSSSYERAQGSGRLRGPRTPPGSSSTPNLRSGWPAPRTPLAGPVRKNSGHRRRRSGSCPELPPLDMGSATLRPIGPVKLEQSAGS